MRPTPSARRFWADWISHMEESSQSTPSDGPETPGVAAAAERAYQYVSADSSADRRFAGGDDVLRASWWCCVLSRGESGPVLNTHFRGLHAPMGLPGNPAGCLAGNQDGVFEFHDMPAVSARKIKPADPPMSTMRLFCRASARDRRRADSRDDLGSRAGPARPRGNCRICGLSTRGFPPWRARSRMYSFIPRWKPPFITALAPEDRCHLNGFCLRDGKLRYVTALRATDSPGRLALKAGRGNSHGDSLGRDHGERPGSSMPHSPRWLQRADVVLGKRQRRDRDHRSEERKIPRGLPPAWLHARFDFAGPHAFVGLSQVRETPSSAASRSPR